jgi:lipopolysaccharide transport system ATP-binding protein
MSNTIINVENISKSYLLKHQQTEKYVALRDIITNKAKSIFASKNSDLYKNTNEEFWALKDISFEVKQGDRVGIIGRNGAGKSTLLKVLSRIVTPTSGRITIDGRVASLLEVGTGFHPELSGRENIFLNGSILGMSKKEIQSKFDEIVAFAEVEKFLDTPVKRYSSGMYVRLAFAVAAHLEPEILIVDEVLAVGDSVFQKKCLGKMKDVSAEGRTVLFVSHNMAAIQNLCDKGIYLKMGKIEMVGEANQVINNYLKASLENQSINLTDRKDRIGNGAIKFTSIILKDKEGNELQALQSGSKCQIEISYSNSKYLELNNFHIAFAIDDENGHRITQFNNEATNYIFQKVAPSCTKIIIQVEKLPLSKGTYSFVLYSTIDFEIADWIQEAGFIEVDDGDFYNTGKSIPDGQGNFYIEHSFKIK